MKLYNIVDFKRDLEHGDFWGMDERDALENFAIENGYHRVEEIDTTYLLVREVPLH